MLRLVLALAWVAISITNHILWGGHLARPLGKTAASLVEVAVFLFEPQRTQRARREEEEEIFLNHRDAEGTEEEGRSQKVMIVFVLTVLFPNCDRIISIT
jgi:hypothetical protein